MFHIRDNFKTLISRVAAREFNRLANFVNNISGGDFITVERPDVPTADTPPRITLRFDSLKERFVEKDQSSGTNPETNGNRLLVTNANGSVGLHDVSNAGCVLATDAYGKLKYVDTSDMTNAHQVFVIKSFYANGDELQIFFEKLTIENGFVTGCADDDAFSLQLL